MFFFYSDVQHIVIVKLYMNMLSYCHSEEEEEKRKLEVRLMVHMTSLTSAECDCVHAKEIARNHCFDVIC